MGTVLSLSPSYRKATLFEDGAATVGHYTAVQNSKNAKDKNLKRHSIISVLPWKRIVAVSAKKKNSKKVQPNSSYQNNITHLNNENLKKSLSCANLSTFAQPPPAQPPALNKCTLATAPRAQVLQSCCPCCRSFEPVIPPARLCSLHDPHSLRPFFPVTVISEPGEGILSAVCDAFARLRGESAKQVSARTLGIFLGRTLLFGAAPHPPFTAPEKEK